MVAGAGKWYVPSLGELVMLYGVDEANVSDRACELGATGETIKKVNYTLEKLSSKQASWKMANGFSGQVASKLNKYYWSSTQYDADNQWTVSMEDGCRKVQDRSVRGQISVRAALIF